jgi:hypothetical protein
MSTPSQSFHYPVTVLRSSSSVEIQHRSMVSTREHLMHGVVLLSRVEFRRVEGSDRGCLP